MVTYNQVTDVQILHDKGTPIPADWPSAEQQLTVLFDDGFPVRKGNPKNIHDWNDLVRSDVKLIFPNPKPRVTPDTPTWRHGARRIKLMAAIKLKPNSL